MTYRDFIRAMNCTLDAYGNKVYLQRTYTRGDGRSVFHECDLVTGHARCACMLDARGLQCHPMLDWDRHGDLVRIYTLDPSHRRYYSRRHAEAPWKYVSPGPNGLETYHPAPDFDPAPYIREVLGDLL